MFKNKKRKYKDILNKQIIFFFVTLVFVLISFFSFSYFFNKLRDPCFDYHGFKTCRVFLDGTNITFYSIPVSFKVAGTSSENNVVIRTDPRKFENLNISINVPPILLKTRPYILYITMDPDSNSQT